MALPKELDVLTPKQKEFVLSFIETKNGTEACRRAGYKGDDNALGVQAHENLSKPKIKAALDAITAPALKKHALTIDSVMGEIASIALADKEDFVEIKHKSDGRVLHADLKLRDKLTALKMAGDHVGAWKQTDPGNAQRFQFAVNMSEDEARAMLQSLLKAK